MRKWNDAPLVRHKACPQYWLAASEMFASGARIYRAHSEQPAICTGAGKTQQEAIARRDELKPLTERLYA